jgi:DNA-binding SARP family transcriptional activator
MEIRWRIELLGGLRVTSDCHVITHFRTHKAGALLSYLAYHLHRAHPREELIDLFWPDLEPSHGRNNLSKVLTGLRDQLEPTGVPEGAVLIADRTSARLNPAAVSTDVAAFVAALRAAARVKGRSEQARCLADAIEAYGGRLLAGYYDDWILGEQERLLEAFARAGGELVALLEQADDLPGAVAYARRVVAADPLREEAHRELMRLLAAAGQPGAALRQYRELERILRDELGFQPEAATLELAERLSDQCRVGDGGMTEPALPLPARGLRDAAGHAAARNGQLAPHRSGNFAPEEQPGTPAFLQEPVGGAVPLDSAFYVVRPVDGRFHAAVRRQESIVLVRGAREMGKTSLLARGLQQAREVGARVAFTDFLALHAAHLAQVETFWLTLAQRMAVQLNLSVLPQDVWNDSYTANLNFELYLQRQVLGKSDAPLVWGLDGVDRLFATSFGADVFALFRSWHNSRSLDPAGPWSRLTLAIAYATEVSLFITDLNQSPFNVGTRLTLEDFTIEQVVELNRRYGSPLRNDWELARFYGWVGGHPYLVRRALQEMAAREMDLTVLETETERDTGIYGDHLRRLLASLTRDTEYATGKNAVPLREAVRAVLRGEPCPTEECFYRLRSAGVMAGETCAEIQPRCRLYATYLARHLL